jgi:sulfide:quinone oxidoreductase
MARAVVLGGGFGGVAAANELRAQLPDEDEVVLVDRRDSFAMGFAKLWDLAGLRPLEDGRRSLRDLERKGIRFVQADITEIDASARRVVTSAGTFDADALMVALGSRPAATHRGYLDVPGAHDLYDEAALPAIRADLERITSGRVVVSILGGPFKCPPAPYEAALIVDALLRDRQVREDVEVVVTTPQPMTLPVAGVDASRYVADHLDDHGVGLRSGVRVSGVDGERRVVMFADDGGEVGFDLLLGVPADTLPPVLVDAGLAGGSGWLEPDPASLRLGHDRVAAVGDCTRIPTATAQLPHAGVFAAAQGRVAARNLVADLTGSPEQRFDGHGYCFLELPGQQVAFVEGDFYADPPDVRLTPADHEQFLRKQAYERDHLAAWFD